MRPFSNLEEEVEDTVDESKSHTKNEATKEVVTKEEATADDENAGARVFVVDFH
jgi:hypothetical protein